MNRFQGIPGITSQEQLREHVLAKGCYSPAENLRIYNKWFTAKRPRDHLWRFLDEKFNVTNGTVCDVGCAYGMTLIDCPQGSYGIELEDYQCEFARSIGLTVLQKDVIHGDWSDVHKVDTVWCAATLEHVDAPHVFLRRLFYLLKPGGRIIIEVPHSLPAAWMKHVPQLNYLYSDHDDHINSFTATALERIMERAGFKQERSIRYSTPLVGRKVPVWLTGLPLVRTIADSQVYVGRSIPDWEYPKKATRRAADNPNGYVFRSMFADAATDKTKEAKED